MNLWNVIDKAMEEKGYNKTTLHEKLTDVFEGTGYDAGKYKAFTKRFETSKITAEELFHLSYILDINIGDLQDIFNTNMNSLLDTRVRISETEQAIVNKYSNFYNVGDYYEMIPMTVVPEKYIRNRKYRFEPNVVNEEQYLLNINHNSDKLSLELVNVRKNLIKRIGEIKEASTFLVKKSNGLETFKNLNKRDKIKLILDRIELDNQVYGTRDFEPRVIVKGDLDTLTKISFDQLSPFCKNVGWSYYNKSRAVIYRNENSMDKRIFEASLKFTKMCDEYEFKKTELVNQMPFDTHQYITACEVHGMNALLYYDSKSKYLGIEIIDTVSGLIIDRNDKSDIKIYMNLDENNIMDYHKSLAFKQKLKRDMYAILRDTLKSKGIVDIPKTVEEAEAKGKYQEKEIYSFDIFLDNLSKKLTLEKEIEAIGRELTLERIKLNEQGDVFVENLGTYRPDIFGIYSSPVSVDVCYRKTNEKYSEYELVMETKIYTPETNTLSTISSECIYDSEDPHLYSEFDYEKLPEMLFNRMKEYLCRIKR